MKSDPTRPFFLCLSFNGPHPPWCSPQAYFDYHHEHSPCYQKDSAYQSLVGRDWKYVWNPITGAERLFSRRDDPHELIDLSADPEHAEVLGEWRLKLTRELQGRPENLSDGETLKTGKVPVWRDPRGECVVDELHEG